MNFRRCAGAALLWSVGSLVLHSSPSLSQTAATGRVPTVSRLVVQFTERETRLAERISAGDAAGAEQLLTEDFELRAGSQAARPIPRADWIRQSIASPVTVGAPTQMAVHDLGDTMAVSFVQTAGNASLFVVDVWRRAGAEWKLAIRYAAPASTGNAAIPGAPPSEPPIRKKY